MDGSRNAVLARSVLLAKATATTRLGRRRRSPDDPRIGERSKIFNVHFRNIKGRKLDFMEAFPDEGDIDMPRALAAYRDIGYPYMLMPDHVPQIDGRDPSGVAFAYCYGYIQALVDALMPRTGGGRA
jgi:D-mannonate dehydratase (UxuA)